MVRTSGGSSSVAFDGTTYAVAFSALTGVDTSGENCGVCETDLSQDQQVITGTLAGEPRVVAQCSTENVGAPAAQVALAAGRPFFTEACHAGIRSVDGTFDAEGTLPLRGAGTWLSYARADAARVLDLVGGGSYTVPAAAGTGALWLQADGSMPCTPPAARRPRSSCTRPGRTLCQRSCSPGTGCSTATCR